MVKIKRHFHPIGQGGFFSEHHKVGLGKEFVVVYDCGVAHNRSSADGVVKTNLLNGVEIDILFISHFDYDHVCKLKVLSSHVGRIKNVVMPLLSKDEKFRLTNLFRASGFNLLKLINSPEKFFGSTTRVFSVAPGGRQDADGDGPRDEAAVSLDSLSPTKSLRSGVKISVPIGTVPHSHDWVFIPYNYESATNLALLEAELTKVGISTHRIKTDPKYTLDKSIVGRKIIKGVYSRLPGGINLNSMIVYSGPENRTSRLRLRENLQDRIKLHRIPWLKSHAGLVAQKYPVWKYYFLGSNDLRALDFFFDDEFEYLFQLPGCIYTGDVDFNQVEIPRVFREVWDQVGTLQIPHHGAAPCFDDSILKGQKLICPIAVGTKFLRKYGHPAKSVIDSIIMHGCVPVFVTELNEEFVQIIS
ncbi:MULTISPECIES: hypothetical protein [Pseudomonas]|uniref:Metallo-beta-lactamase domain-containing protein n=2 Tax=Pseudomonas putida TaxID=303 RepID=A0A6B7Q040_PSEPU|nr:MULTISPECIES: hypothetical protein [Pseudomonas]QFX76657.1 hypothetical protein [Pseudomonas putida]